MDPQTTTPGDPPLGCPIYSYTRAQAIADGVLVDLTEPAREAGFKWPLAATDTAWGLISSVPPTRGWQDARGRLWDVLQVARFAISVTLPGENVVQFRVSLPHGAGAWLDLKLMAGPGDDGEPVLTLMLPHED